jgi:type I restriction enzyme S subunit
MRLISVLELADVISKGTTPTSLGRGFSRTGIPFIRGENVHGGVIAPSSISTFIDCPTHEVLSRSALQKGDVLVTIAGSIGRVGFLDDDVEQANCNQAVAFIRFRPGVIDPNWICLLLQSPSYQKKFATFTVGGAIPNVSLQQIGSIEIPVLDLSHQRARAMELQKQLSELKNARDNAFAQTENSHRLFESIYRSSFPHVPAISCRALNAEQANGWIWRKLSDVARLESGHTPSRQRPEWWGGDVSWISLTEIRALDGQWVEETKLKTNAEGIANSAARILPRGTVCFSRTASVGFVTIMAKPMATSQDFANWVCGDQLDPEFLMHALIASRQSLREIATGATHKTIYMPALESFQICMPKIDEQRWIVRRLKAQLSEAAAIAKAAADQLAEIERLPQRLLAQAFGEAS